MKGRHIYTLTLLLVATVTATAYIWRLQHEEKQVNPLSKEVAQKAPSNWRRG
jgi:hypothetical protein